MKHADSRYKRLQTNLMRNVDAALVEGVSGVRKLSVSELKALHDILRAERPSVFAIQSVIVNALAFLNTYNVSQETRAAISDFLHEFQQDAARTRLNNDADVMDGLKLAEGMI